MVCALYKDGQRGKQRAHLRNQTDVYIGKVLVSYPELELPEGLYKRHTLNVSNCTTKLGGTKKSALNATVHIQSLGA